MKKILLVAAFAIAAQFANAQVFVGGSLGFSTVKDGVTAFGIAPEVGYSITDRWDVGIALGIGTYSADLKNAADKKFTGSEWGVAPFVRYKAIQTGKWDFMLKGSVGYFGGSQGGFEFDGDVIGDDLGEEKLKSTEFSVSIVPMVAYNVSDRFTLFAQLNCLGVDFTYSEEKQGDLKADGTSFGLMADTNNLLNTGNFQVGFNINF